MFSQERIGQEFYGQDSVDPFPALEKLEFQDMPNWVEWDEVSETDFPSLCELKIKDSNELRVLPQKLPSHLKKLVIINCEKSQEPDGASYDQEVLETLRDDSEDDFKVLSEDEDDDDFYDRMFEVGQSSGMAIDYNDDSDDAC
nr:unnamed protein product [Digitaria exilis]